MANVLIYREDLTIFVLKEANKPPLPEVEFSTPEQLQEIVKDRYGFSVGTSGNTHNGFVAAKRIWGDISVEHEWKTIEKLAKELKLDEYLVKEVVNREIRYWHKAQLELMEEVFDLFRKEEIDIYLRGGWAADFLAGKITRPHVDIDAEIWFEDKEKIIKLLKARGFSIREKEKKIECYKGSKLVIEMYPKPNSEKSLKQYKGAVAVELNGITAKVWEPNIFKEYLEKRLEFYRKHPGEFGGPAGKIDHDLSLVREYLLNLRKKF